MSSICECGKSELSLFDAREVQTSMEKAGFVDIHPLTNPSSGGPIEFFIPGGSEDYLDLNDTMLYVKGSVRKEDKSNLPANSRIALTNLPLASLFSDVSLVWNEKQTEGGSHLYAYKSFFQFMMNTSEPTALKQGRCVGFYKDEGGKMEDAGQKGFTARRLLIQDSQKFELIGPLYLDAFQQGRYLISHVDQRIKILRAKPELCLMSFNTPSEGGNAAVPALKGLVDLEEVILYVRRVKVSPSVILGHEKGLLKQNACYPIQRTDMQTFTIPQGSQSFTKDNLFRGQLPKFMMMGMVENDAFNGNYKKNMFHFQPFDLNFLALYRDGEAIPNRPFTPEFERKLYMREYNAFFHALQLYNQDETLNVTFEDFCDGYTLFAFNLSPDMSLSGHEQPYRDGNLRMEFKFAKGLGSAINVIIMAIFDGRIEITKNREILLDYKA
jgi:hypothetical protein